jgi:hypothetical protein
VGLPPEPPDEQPAPPPPVGAEGGECPRCGTAYEPFQEYCLECGLRLPVSRGIIPVLATAWRRRVARYPGDWIWPVLAALVIAALGAAIAIAITTDNGSPTRTQAGTEPVPTGTGTVAEPPPPAGTETSTLPTDTIPTTEPEPEPPPPPASTELVEWPAGQNGWTIVLASVPQSAGRAGPTREARRALSRGLTDVGVLNSSEYSSLHPNFWVVFTGIHTSESEARGALDDARSSYAQAYVRQIAQ